jgi:outer membrane cobalamin receptor
VTPTSQVTIATGFQVAGSTLAVRPALDRWVQTDWRINQAWTLSASSGSSHQFPDLDLVRQASDLGRLQPERAAHLDVGLAHQASDSLRWTATVYARQERDVLRAPEIHPMRVGGALIDWPVRAGVSNALRGSSRGIELLVERRRPTGLSGWAAYSYGRARYVDAGRGETFWSDFDQRHAVNVSVVQRLPQAMVGVTFRAGTNFPIPGYLVDAGGSLYAGEDRNRVRLPRYARVDLRAERTFTLDGRRVTIFGEVVNLLNRTNLGPADGFVVRETGEAVGFTERLFPRIGSAGVRILF